MSKGGTVATTMSVQILSFDLSRVLVSWLYFSVVC